MNHSNVVPIRKTDRFCLFRGSIENAHVTELERLGVAYRSAHSSIFHLNFWMFPGDEYILAKQANSDEKFRILSYGSSDKIGSPRGSHFQQVGEGRIHGNFIRLKFYLLPTDIFLCLVPEVVALKVGSDVA